MSEIIINRHGVEQQRFSITTSGDSVASCTLDDLLLNPELDYVMRVQQLDAPMSGLPIFGFDTDGKPLNKELFRVKRRVPGTNLQQFLAGFETSAGAVNAAHNFDSAFKTQEVKYIITPQDL